MCIWGKVVVSVHGDDAKLFTGVGSLGWTRKFKWSGITDVRESTKFSSKGGAYSVVVLEGATRLSFGSGIKENRLYFMRNALSSLLRQR